MSRGAGAEDLFSRFPTVDMDAVTKFITRKGLYLVPKAEKYYQKALWTMICTLCAHWLLGQVKCRNPPLECLDRTFRVKEIKTQSTRVSVITGIPDFWCWTPHRFLLWHHLQHLYLLLNILCVCVCVAQYLCFKFKWIKINFVFTFCNICWAF